MTRTDLVDPADRAGSASVGPRRTEVLALLRAATAPLSVAAMAEQTGLHVNTARFHLDALVTEGLAERSSEQRVVPGRPRVLYAPRGPVLGPRSFRLLAEMLTGLVASRPDAGPAAVDAGRAWGRHLVDRSEPSRQLGADEAVTRLVQVLDDVGFQPEAHLPNSGLPELRLHNCPFREVAEQHHGVVCGLHLGLMRGALEELRAAVVVTGLDPFVTPTLCLAQLDTVTSTG